MDRSLRDVAAVLLDREHELERLRLALHSVGHRAGRAMVVEGPAGMGKSRLLEEAQTRAANLGVRVLTARATEFEQGFPFGVVRQLFERALLEADSGQRERWLAGVAALAAEVLTGAPSETPVADPSAGDASYAWHHGLYWLASNLAADAPLALIVDDLQWCDAPSARTLAFIARRLEAGTVNINEGYAATWGSTDAPMGGLKDSGIGRRHGAEGIRKYTAAQTVSVQRLVQLEAPASIAQETWERYVTASLRLLRRLPLPR